MLVIASIITGQQLLVLEYRIRWLVFESAALGPERQR